MAKKKRKTPKAKREMLGGFMTHLSFVDQGATRIRPVLKAKNTNEIEVVAQVTKFDPREHLLYSLVYGPDVVDAHGDFAGPAVVKHYCHNFLRPGGGHIDSMHTLIDEPDVHVAENTIVQKGDRRFDTVDYDGDPVDTEGWWGVVLKIENEEIEAKCLSGEIGGISMFGRRAYLRPVDTTDFTSALARRLGDDITNKELDMDEKVLAELFKNALKPLAEVMGSIQKSLEPKPEPKVEVKPEPKVEVKPVIKFEGDPADPKALAKHKDAVYFASCDLSTPEGITLWEKYLATKEPVKKSEGLLAAEAARDAAETKVEELRKASTQKTGDDTRGNETTVEKRLRVRKNAREMAKKHNESLGRK